MPREDHDHLALPATGKTSKRPQVHSRRSEGLLVPGLHKPEDTSPSSLTGIQFVVRLGDHGLLIWSEPVLNSLPLAF